FSVFYVAGALGLCWAIPGDFNLWFVMAAFALGLIGMEFATIFTNAMLPGLGSRKEIGRISGSGWGFGYLGGMVALIVMVTLFAENASGRTLIGIAPVLGLDPALREGTRAVGPFTALWYAVFMIPFFLFVRDVRPAVPVTVGTALRGAWPELKSTLAGLPANRSLLAYLLSSMFYRDALNGIYVFGGLYAAGVLGWSIIDVAIFGILGTITGATFAWAGGKADDRFGPKPVIVLCVIALALVTLGVIYISRDAVFGMPVMAESRLPDIAFYVMGGLIGAAGGALQSASRTMMVRQSDPEKITESFGLYALAGKATSFIAPLSIGVVTQITGSQQAGIVPLIGLFGLGLVLLVWVKPNGGPAQ
ncbi:MFS transporter, partial [Candidatus Falkowbacteria bacterium]|nr:MFS transporter [Candidatus Falkowbacteria bacterium]